MAAEKINTGITAFRSGDRAGAKQVFSEIVRSDPGNESAWLWLGACVDDVEQKKFCFKKVLEINPNNTNAQKALSEIIKPLAPVTDDFPDLNDLVGAPSIPRSDLPPAGITGARMATIQPPKSAPTAQPVQYVQYQDTQYDDILNYAKQQDKQAKKLATVYVLLLIFSPLMIIVGLGIICFIIGLI